MNKVLEIDEIRKLKVEELKEKFSNYLLPGTTPQDRLDEKLGEVIRRILDSATTLFQVDTASLWYARDDFVTKEGNRAERIVFLDGVGAYNELKEEITLQKILKDLGEYPNYKFYPSHIQDSERERSGTGFVATFGTQIITHTKSPNAVPEGDGISLDDIQEERGEKREKKGKYDKYIYGDNEFLAKAFDYVIIQPLIYERRVIGVLKVEKRNAYTKTPDDFTKGQLLRKLLICLNQIAPYIAQVLEEKKELLHVMEYRSPGIGYSINLKDLDEHNITMRFIEKFKNYKEVFEWGKEEFTKFLDSIINNLKREGKDLVLYKLDTRVKELRSIVEKLIRFRRLAVEKEKKPDDVITTENVFKIFKDIVGVRLIFRFQKYRNDFCEHLLNKITGSGWQKAKLAKDSITNKEEENPRNTVNNPDESGYRALHLWLEYDIPKEKFKKLQGLDKIIVEIQMRTLMEDAWAQKTHPLLYKGKWYRIKKSARDTLQFKFAEESKKLYDVDKTTEDIRDLIEKGEL